MEKETRKFFLSELLSEFLRKEPWKEVIVAHPTPVSVWRGDATMTSFDGCFGKDSERKLPSFLLQR